MNTEEKYGSQTDIVVTCLFGNGFDLALGLKTRFDDFINCRYLEEYRPAKGKPVGNMWCNRLADQIACDAIVWGEKTWADAETAFANLNEDVLGRKEYEPGRKEDKPEQNFKTLYDDFSEKLARYLKEQDEAVDKIEETDWNVAGRTLLENVYNRVDEMFRLDMRQVSSVTVNFITLNYTRTLDKMVHAGMTHRVRRTSGGRTVAVKVGQVLSAHGKLADGNIVFGIDDVADVADANVRAACADYFVKDNQAWKHQSGGMNKRVEGFGLLERSDYALLFGLAFGKSDAEWWRKLYAEAFDERGRLRLVVCSFKGDEGKTLLLGDEGRDQCRKVFEGSVSQPDFDVNMKTYWQRMGAFAGKDILGIGGILPALVQKAQAKAGGGSIAQAADGEARKKAYEKYLAEKKNAGDAFAKTCLERVEEYAQWPSLDVEKLESEDMDKAAFGDASSRRRIYERELSRFLKHDEKNRFNSEMFEWLEEHADGTSSSEVLFVMGWLRQRGTGTLIDIDNSKIDIGIDKSKAVAWYTKAAEKGNSDAQFNLAGMYYSGVDVPVDKVKAVEWYMKAAEQGNVSAQNKLGDCYSHGEGVLPNKAKAEEWYMKAAKKGDVEAQFNLAWMYDSGDGISVDKANAVKWYRESAKKGNSLAQCNLGHCYNYGEGVPTDKEKAIDWYTKAAEQGNVEAQFNLALMFDKGDGIAPNKMKAVKWFTKAAEQGFLAAQFLLAEMYANGNGVPVNKTKAVEWYKMASEQKSPAAQYNLALMYEKGDGVRIDKAKAVELYTKAAEQGHAKAKAALKRLGEV